MYDRSTQNTSVGSIASLSIFVFVLATFIIQLTDSLKGEHPNVVSNEEFTENPDVFLFNL